MTEVGFYHLTRTPLVRALPMLLEKIIERGFRVVLLAGSPERVASLNEVLWTYEQRSWLPHGTAGDGASEAQPIFLTFDEDNPNDAKVLVTVDGMEPGFLSSFDRVIDMFDGQDDQAVAEARKRWKNHRDNGLKLTYWEQQEKGGWRQRQ